MKRYYYCNYTALFIAIHYYYTVIAVPLNEFQGKLHLEVAVIFNAGNNKPWKGDSLVSRQVVQVVKPERPV